MFVNCIELLFLIFRSSMVNNSKQYGIFFIIF